MHKARVVEISLGIGGAFRSIVRVPYGGALPRPAGAAGGIRNMQALVLSLSLVNVV